MSISISTLGKNGRLANQMFQYAALRGISSNRGFDYSIPKNKIELYKCFNISIKDGILNDQKVTHDGFEFDENLFLNCPDNTDLYGYFQTEKYFKHIENEIRKEFTFTSNIDNICSHYMEQKFSGEKVASLHIRRGDYLNDPNFEVLDHSYYKKALEIISGCQVIIFTDDIDWVSNNFMSERFIISKSKNQFIDLCLMTKCNYHIIANSSFSWWGSWLAKSEKTIAPKKWFAGNLLTWNTKDLYLDDWIIL